MGLAGIIEAAGSARSFAIVLTTTITTKLTFGLTADQRRVALEELLERIQRRHERFVKQLVPKVRPLCPDEPDFQDTDHTTNLLLTITTRLDDINDKFASGGLLFRWSPTSMEDELDDLDEELEDLNENTLRTTATARGVVEKLLLGKKKKVTLVSEKKGEELVQLHVSLAPEVQNDSKGSN